MPAVEFTRPSLEANYELNHHPFAGPATGEIDNTDGIENTAHAKSRDTIGVDWLYTIAGQLAGGETLDEVFASAFNFITALVDCEMCLAHVLQGGKFEQWVWKIPERKNEASLSLEPDVRNSLALHKSPIAISGKSREDRRVRTFGDWDPDGEVFISVPLLFRARLVGAISFRHAPRVYTASEAKLLSAIGFVIGADIGVSLAEAENAALREDLETRKLVQRGQGLLQRDLRISEQQAYLILEHLSRQRRKPVKEIARAIVLGDEVKRGAVVT